MEYKTLILALLFCAASVQALNISPRIYNGTPANQERLDTAYVVMIHGINFVCSGILVSARSIITAASCFDSMNGRYDDVYIMEGRQNVIESGYGSVTVHENYNNETKENNIAFITTGSSFPDEKRFNPTSVDTAVRAECRVTGFGTKLPNGDSDMSAYSADVIITDCETQHTGHICARLKDDADVHGILCKGDIGAPLVCNNELVGIAVSDNSCGTGDPDVYQDIRDFTQWIENKIRIYTIQRPVNTQQSVTSRPTTTEEPGTASTFVLSPLVLFATLAVIFITTKSCALLN